MIYNSNELLIIQHTIKKNSWKEEENQYKRWHNYEKEFIGNKLEEMELNQISMKTKNLPPHKLDHQWFQESQLETRMQKKENPEFQESILLVNRIIPKSNPKNPTIFDKRNIEEEMQSLLQKYLKAKLIKKFNTG
jgi:hypothetical protein